MLLQTLFSGDVDCEEADSSDVTPDGRKARLRSVAACASEKIAGCEGAPLDQRSSNGGSEGSRDCGPISETYRNKHVFPKGKGSGKGSVSNVRSAVRSAVHTQSTRIRRARGGAGRFRRGCRGGRRSRSHSRRRSRSRQSAHRHSYSGRRPLSRGRSSSTAHSDDRSSAECRSESNLTIVA